MSSTTVVSQQQQQPRCRQDSYDEDIYSEFSQPVSNHKSLAKDAVMESSVSSLASPPPPPVPRRNARRSRSMSRSASTSRSSTSIPDTAALNLGGAKELLLQHAASSTKQEIPTPHDVYLSSEEDASSSADDFSDFEWESGSEFEYADDVEIAEATTSSTRSSSSTSSPSGPRRRSHEITARVVSVVHVGKPAIVDLSTPKKRASPASTRSVHTPTPITTKLAPAQFSTPPSPTRRRSVSAAAFARRLSVSSTASYITGPSASAPPARTKTAISSVFSRKGQQPLFLNTDPFANGSSVSLASSQRRSSSKSVSSGSPPAASANEAHPLRTPKTPTEKIKDFSLRGGALLKKRSRSILNAAHNLRESYHGAGVATLPEENGSGSSREASRSNTPAGTPTARTQSSADYFSTPVSSARSVPIRAQSDMSITAVPVSPTEMKGKRFTSISARRQSIRAATRP